jgi:hypothetical protein
MPLTVTILGATRLARAAASYVTERRGARLSGFDPGEEHEGDPWFAPVRGLARDNGAAVGRPPADWILDLDPGARPTVGAGPMLRVLAPRGARSPDVNRALLDGGEWAMAFTPPDGQGAWAIRPLEIHGDAVDMLDEATLRGIEALDEGWEAMLSGAPPTPLPRPLLAGRFRPQETWVVWEQPGPRVVARVRACAGPYGGARTNAGEGHLFLLDARLVADEAPFGFDPGVIVEVGESLDIATGKGVLRVDRVRPGWRPARPAGAWAREVGLSVGYQLG